MAKKASNKSMMELNPYCGNSPLDLKRNNQFKKFITSLKSLSIYDIFVKNRLVLAGGSLVRMYECQNYLTIHDYDFYFKEKKYIQQLLNDIDSYNTFHKNNKFELLNKTKNAYTFTLGNFTFQFIVLREMINIYPQKIISYFDFSICQIAYDFEFDDVECSDIWRDDMDTKTITFNTNTLYPLASFVRLDKYIQRGYTMKTISKLSLALTISQLNIKTYNDAGEQMNGVSTAILQGFAELLMSDEYKNKKFNVEEFIKLYNEYFEMLETLEELN